MLAKIIERSEDLECIEDDWHSLMDKSSDTTPFQSFEWNKAWIDVYGSGTKLFVVVVYSGAEVVAIFPLMICKENLGPFQFRKMQFIGAGKTDYLGPLVAGDPEAAWLKAIEAIYDNRNLWDILELARMCTASTGFQSLQRVLGRNKLTREITRQDDHCLGCPSITIDGSWQEYYTQRLKAEARQGHRRRYRNLGKKGEISFFQTSGDNGLVGLFEEMLQVESRSWKGQQASGIFKGNEDREFMIRICSTFAGLGWLRISGLRLDKRLLSYQIGFLFKNHFYSYNTSYDSSFRKYAPGILLMKHFLENSFNAGYCEFDFGQGEQKYKLDWSTNIRKVNSVLLFNNRSRSNFYFLLEKRLHPMYHFLRQQHPFFEQLHLKKTHLM